MPAASGGLAPSHQSETGETETENSNNAGFRGQDGLTVNDEPRVPKSAIIPIF